MTASHATLCVACGRETRITDSQGRCSPCATGSWGAHELRQHPIEDPAATRLCAGCGETKPTGDFLPEVHEAGRPQGNCRRCRNAYAREHYGLHNHKKEERLGKTTARLGGDNG